ncbi:DUF2849 domain-containing protein [Albirhodobacter sp. R86504]|jgi:hypothetical protein|uniref:DUF2849 domain-containing protein n=1 Tax=Albirhodobacter sp. R86504 TaxID=3093848 RepID=UPI00366AD237
MSKAYQPKVVTANALREGDAVYFRADGTWSRAHEEALLLEDADAAEAHLARAAKDQHLIVGAYLADAKAGENGPEPVHFREVFRTKGPSNYFHGKQEAN